MKAKNKDKSVAVISIIAIVVLAVVVVNIDRIFPPPKQVDLDFSSKVVSFDNTDYSNASVTVLEFSDFKCPFCADVSGTVERLAREYAGRVHFEFKHMAGHIGSDLMAEAAECAKAQGKFWEYHHLLFAEGMQSDSDLLEYAEDVGLDVDKFDSCLANGETSLKVENDFNEGISAGITGTPTFVINGQIYPGALEYERFKAIIEEELAKNE
jgi:protein-disulfide isomerase